jgi:hypothetical protein
MHLLHLHHTKGKKVKPTEQTAKTPVAATGCFAMLGGMFHTRGSGARSVSFAAALAVMCLAFAATSAQAAVVHEYLGSEEPSAYTPYPGTGQTVVKDESMSLNDWAEGDTYELNSLDTAFDVFTPTRELVGELAPPGISPPNDDTVSKIAIDDATGDAIVQAKTGPTGEGSQLFFFEPTVVGHWSPSVQLKTTQVFTQAFGVDESSGEKASGEIFAATTYPFYGQTDYVGSVIDEFAPSGAYVAGIVSACKIAGETPPCGQGDLVPLGGYIPSVSVNPVTHDIYVENGEYGGNEVVDIFAPDAVAPDVATGGVSRLKGMSVTLNGTVNPLGEGAASCQFAWGAAGELGHTVACGGEVAEGDGPVAVQSARLEGLSPDTEYCYRLQARNKAKGGNPGGFNGGEASQDRCFTTPGPADVHGFATEVTADAAALHVEVDPRGVPTSYYIEYGGMDTEGCAAEPALCSRTAVAAVGQSETPVVGEQLVQGLSPQTVYHYRVVEVREPEPGQVEEYSSPDQTFTTQGAGTEFVLPDGRQYELVSPPQKHGALFMGDPEESFLGGRGCDEHEECRIQAAAAGDAFVDEAQQPSEEGAVGDANSAVVLMTRSVGGWSSQVISTPHLKATGAELANPGPEYGLFSEDLSRAVLDHWGGFEPLSPEAVEPTPYLRTNYSGGDVNDHCEAPDLSVDSCYEPLVTRANTAPGTVFGDEFNGECPYIDCGPQVVAGTRDLSHVIVAAREPLTEEPVVVSLSQGQELGVAALYEFYQGRLRLVNILPGRTVGGEARLPANSGDAEHVISADGDRVILERAITVDHFLRPQGSFYVRDVSKGETVELPGGYFTANDEDTRIFTIDNGALDECELVEVAGKDACKTTDLTPEMGGEPPNVQSVLGASEDGSYVYFAAGAKLAPGATANDICNVPGTVEFGPCNLYVYHDGVTRFIAELSAEDLQDFDLSSAGAYGPYLQLHARVSPDGRWLAFMSDRELTGYDNRDAVSGQPDAEVYLYHAPEALASEAGSLSCVSCDPTGARPVGLDGRPQEDSGGTEAWVAAALPGWSEEVSSRAFAYQPRYLSDSGRLFFDSKDALVPLDVNGVTDVYEYEPAGDGGESGHPCTAASAGGSEAFKGARAFQAEGVAGEEAAGCVALISSGTSAQPSAFLEASETGGDVFFITASKLSPLDLEGGLSIYDAQECTGAVPCPPPPAVSPPPCGNAEACRAAPAPQPGVFGAPSTATFNGPGDVAPEVAPPPKKVVARKTVKCKKPKKRSKGKCVKQKSKKHRARKSARKSAKARH